ncbi:hypothetical protein M378DRAFT_18264 [Amanita muscaria Koide BX008]|uniref:Uncharacterized protein n=1 Tax=Amanita muscaria (strain Koide BX008) TaxID=946122 RepID=A0A0C2W1U4_AMAMK|nr:hypothetical protein M378DRAFT_18264 [Amanita muscaria Koide BX008]
MQQIVLDTGHASKRRRGEAKLTRHQLSDTIDAMSSLASPELAILRLFDHYDVDLDDLRRLLMGLYPFINMNYRMTQMTLNLGVEKGLDVSFSNVKYRDIAPRVGLQFELAGRDMPTIDIRRARIPTSLFKDIIGDVQIIMNLYGEPACYRNEEARSWFLGALFNRIVALFDSTVFNAAASVIPSVMTTRGQIRYRFSVFGGISLIVVEFHGLANERLAAIAQVIAECDACDYTNDQLDLPPRIFGILSDGSSFEFFVFNGSAKPAIFSRGIFHTTPGSKPYEKLFIKDYNAVPDATFIRSLRPICETFFYLFLLAYKAGVDRYAEQFAKDGITDSESYLNWSSAKECADEALLLAVDAAKKALAHEDALSIDQRMEEALKCLRESLMALPASHKTEFELLHAWDEEPEKFFYC